MLPINFLPLRLAHQHLTPPFLRTPAEVVSALGAVQAQDYAGAKWALAQRLSGGSTDTALDDAFNNGEILRTHILRPTWHFVTPADIGWMLQLSAPRVHTVNAYMYRQLEIDDATIKKSNTVLTKAVQGGKHKTRAELASALEKSGVSTVNGMRLGYLIHRAELDGILISGPRTGKQFTYALLSERAPQAKTLKRDEALAELTRRYFNTRGPATVQDFVMWSGLTLTDARKGIESLKSEFENEQIENKTYWFPLTTPPPAPKIPTIHLLPNYDEYFIGYQDRSAFMLGAKKLDLRPGSTDLNFHILVRDGQIIGGWRRTLTKNTVQVELMPLTDLTKTDHRALAAALTTYGKFLNLIPELVEPTISPKPTERSLNFKKHFTKS